jgi:O-antigen/teichoic acid export membrane protein
MPPGPLRPSQPTARRRAAAITMIGGYATTAVTVAQGLVLVPLYLHYIGPRLYGVWLASGDILAWLSLLQMGSGSLLIQRVSHALGRGDRDLAARYYATGLGLLLALTTMIVAGAFAVAPWFPAWMGVKGAEVTLTSTCFVAASFATAANILGEGIGGLAAAVQAPGIKTTAAVVGGLAGLATTLALLFSGRGLWAIPIGLIVRSAMLLLANLANAAWLYRRWIARPFRPSSAVLREMGGLALPMFGASLGNALLGRSEAAVVAVMLRPELATLLVLTRRGADVVRMLVNQFNAAAFPGFAHLVGTRQTEKAWRVYGEIMRLYMPVSVLLVAAYLALNRSFMTAWVGGQEFGGGLLTVVIAAATLATCRSGFLGFLLGATGAIVRSNVLVLVESIVRFPLLLGLLALIGLPGAPLAALLTAVVAGWIARRWTQRALAPGAPREAGPAVSTAVAVEALVLIAAALAGARLWSTSWFGFVTFAVVVGAVEALIARWVVPDIGGLLAVFRGRPAPGVAA